MVSPEPEPEPVLAVRLRDGKGWSNKAIARHPGMHPTTVGRWFARPELTATAKSNEETA